MWRPRLFAQLITGFCQYPAVNIRTLGFFILYYLNWLCDWFVATFSGAVERGGEFPSDEVEDGGHVFHRPVSAGFALHG